MLVATFNEAQLAIGHMYRFRGIQVNRTSEAKQKVRDLPETYFVLAPCKKLAPLETNQKGDPPGRL